MIQSQQWPLAPSQTQPSDEFSTSTGNPKLYLLVEQSTSRGDGREWRMTHYPCKAASRAGARLEIEKLAHEFEPQHPMVPQSRTVFRVTPDQYVVEVAGLTSSFHFRITVVEEA